MSESIRVWERKVRLFYVRHLRRHFPDPLVQQRLKILFHGWAYWRLLSLGSLSPASRMRLLWHFLRADWSVLHGHKAREIVEVCRVLGSRRPKSDEAFVEAGCWQGGSSVKFSWICAELGYRLEIYDSFQGVEALPEEERRGFDFSGTYASPEAVLRRNLEKRGRTPGGLHHPCGVVPGHLARRPQEKSIRAAYIDFDSAIGSRAALAGIVPALADDGAVFSQDFFLPQVRRLLEDPATWQNLGRQPPQVAWIYGDLGSAHWPAGSAGPREVTAK